MSCSNWSGLVSDRIFEGNCLCCLVLGVHDILTCVIVSLMILGRHTLLYLLPDLDFFFSPTILLSTLIILDYSLESLNKVVIIILFLDRFYLNLNMTVSTNVARNYSWNKIIYILIQPEL